MDVAVVGAGVAGLVAAKVLKQDGFSVTVFEKEPGVGGVWAESRAYPGLSTNNPREAYVFSDFPHAETTGDFPTAQQVRAYLNAYVDHFGLRPCLRPATEVVAVAREEAGEGDGRGGFQVAVCPVREPASVERHAFDFVVVCNGVLSEPHVPAFDGADRFAGDIIHSSQTPGASALAGKRVAVIGAGKSALDCANFAGRIAASCTLVFRRPYWMLPRYFFGRSRVDRQVFNRWSEMVTFPAYHELPRGEAVLRTLGTPLIPLLWLFRRAQCRFIAWQSRVPAAMMPDTPVYRHIFHQGIGDEVYDGVREGRVTPKRAGVDGFSDHETLRLSTGEEVAADVVICATGWRQQVAFLDDDLKREILPDGRFRLYRHILPPSEPRMGFIGYASSGNAPLTSEVAAHWLSRCFRGEMALPSRADMDASIDHVLAWTAQAFPEQREGHFIGAYIAHYVDWLMRDMGLPTRRAPGLVAEYLGPFWAARYRDLSRKRM